MRYNLESTLPINAFSPRGGRSPFNHGMTLEGGGGGGGVLGGVTKAIGSVVGGVTKAVQAVVQPVYNATLKQIPGVDQALVGLDKSVGNAIPGGWGTVAAVASSFIPGSQLALMGMTQTGLATGLGALSGSGVMHKGNNFNLQGAIMGGAMAYGASQLAQGFQEAGKVGTEAAPNLTSAADLAPKPSPEMIDVNAGLSGTSPSAATPAPQSYFNAAQSNIDPSVLEGMSANQVASSAPQTAFQAAQSNIDPSLLEGMSQSEVASAPVLNTPTPTGLEALNAAGKGTMENLSTAGTGIKNLVGAGTPSISDAASAFTAPITTAGMTSLVGGTMGLSALEEQKKYLEQQLAAGNIAQDQYNAEMAAIDAQIAVAKKAVSDNPLQSSADISGVKNEDTAYGKQNDITYAARPADSTLYDKDPTGGTKLMYAMGGAVPNPPDDQTGMLNQTPMQNFEQGGLMSMIGRTAPQQTFAQGGQARFLSGGGDGMSDSIKANINGSQEARLADGEFVVPADVVSHLGNGSSKAGAKQLYSMMDKVRQARTGTKKQGKQINPRKYLAA